MQEFTRSPRSNLRRARLGAVAAAVGALCALPASAADVAGSGGDMPMDGKVDANVFNIREELEPYRPVELRNVVRSTTLNIRGLTGNQTDAQFDGGTDNVIGTMTVSARAGITSRASIHNTGTSMTSQDVEVGWGASTATGSAAVAE